MIGIDGEFNHYFNSVICVKSRVIFSLKPILTLTQKDNILPYHNSFMVYLLNCHFSFHYIGRNYSEATRLNQATCTKEISIFNFPIRMFRIILTGVLSKIT